MKTILIPTDFSENAWNAFEYAVRLFKDIPCTFYVLHIGDLKDSSIKGNSFIMPAQKIDVSIKEKLGHLFERIRKLPINKEHHFVALQEYGTILNIIRKQIASKNIELIVMGTKGATGLKETIIGSVAGDIITKVACNVLVVPERATIAPPKEVAFPTDYNIFFSYFILEAISETLRLSKANLRVLNIAKDDKQLNSDQNLNKAYLQDYLKETLHTAHSFHCIIDKNIKAAIENFVSNDSMDMVIMVAKNLNFLQQLFFNTTIEKLSFHTRVPMLVLHEKISHRYPHP